MHAAYQDWFNILHNFVNLARLYDFMGRWFQVKTICNGSLSKLSWVFLNNQWFFIIRNTLKGFLLKPLELSVHKKLETNY